MIIPGAPGGRLGEMTFQARSDGGWSKLRGSATMEPKTVHEKMMIEPQLNAVYEIELCSGELRYWQYLGPDSRRLVWWLDMETRQEFNESSLMYAWTIKGLKKGTRAAARHEQAAFSTALK